MMFPRRKPYAGFTLVELMVVVAIIAILAAIAIPSYVDYVTRSKLSEAYNTLSAYRVSMEQYYQDNRTYIGTAAPSMSPCGAVTPTGLKYFKITCLAATSSTYTAQVQGTTGSPTDGFTFAITNANVQQTTAVPTAKGWSLPSTNCWVVRKSGSCQ